MEEVKSSILYCTQNTDNKGRTRFWHFYPSVKSVACCAPEQIFKVKITEDPVGENNPDSYWGWWDTDDFWAKRKNTPHVPNFQFVYPAKMLLGMCFAYGMQAEIDRGNGICLPVTVEILEEIFQW